MSVAAAPGLLTLRDGRASLVRQPGDEAERAQLDRAALLCPVGAIRRGLRG